MHKVTKRGIEKLGTYNEISEEDHEFIEELFRENEEAEKPPYGYALFIPDE